MRCFVCVYIYIYTCYITSYYVCYVYNISVSPHHYLHLLYVHVHASVMLQCALSSCSYIKSSAYACVYVYSRDTCVRRIAVYMMCIHIVLLVGVRRIHNIIQHIFLHIICSGIHIMITRIIHSHITMRCCVHFPYVTYALPSHPSYYHYYEVCSPSLY